jgi:hypothetical protein
MCEPGETTASHQIQKQSLRLIVLVVCAEKPVSFFDKRSKCIVTGLPRCSLETESRFVVDLDGLADKWDVEICCQTPAMRFPFGRLVMQAVIDVKRQNRRSMFVSTCGQRMKEHG